MRAFKIGEVSRKTGVGIEAIRYYERIGVMPAPDRSAGGSRLYVLEQVKRLHFIKRSRELGFSLDDVRRLLRLADGGQSCGEVKALTQKHLASVRAKIHDLRRLEHTLGEVLAKCGDADAPECPVIDALYEAAPRG